MRIGIVNDMALAREALRRVVTSAGYTVAWLASDGAAAISEARRDTPDLILMDLIMPGTDGVEATRRIMLDTPCPIVVVTSTVAGNFGKVYDAMGQGALDAVDTPRLGPGGELEGASPLLAKMATVAKLVAKVRETSIASAPASAHTARAGAGDLLVAIGSSTGGPNALAEVLSAFPNRLEAAVVIIQHVDGAFAPGLARWLAARSGQRVATAEPGWRPEPGKVFLAATNDHLIVDADRRFRYTPEPRDHYFRPSADVFFGSLAAHWPGPGVAALLTGMGRDGAAGLLALRRSGWLTIAQDEATSVVWGMPRAAVELGAAVNVLPLPQIGAAVADHIQNLARNHEARPR